MLGKVKWFNNEKRYGFIIGENNQDVMVHYSCIEQSGYKTLHENQLVEYEPVKTKKGLQAQKVKPVKDLETMR